MRNALESKISSWTIRITQYKIILRKKPKIFIINYWKPIAKNLAKHQEFTKVYFSPDGVYNLINLNTLYNPIYKQISFRRYHRHIHLISNLKDLIHRRQPSTSSQSAVLLGRPNYDLEAAKTSGPK